MPDLPKRYIRVVREIVYEGEVEWVEKTLGNSLMNFDTTLAETECK